MSDWQVGDKAVCVGSGKHTRKGAVYTVSAISVPGDCHEGFVHRGRETYLRFAEIVHDLGRWSEESRFRKIRPDEQQACEPEFVTLLQNIKRKDRVNV